MPDKLTKIIDTPDTSGPGEWITDEGTQGEDYEYDILKQVV